VEHATRDSLKTLAAAVLDRASEAGTEHGTDLERAHLGAQFQACSKNVLCRGGTVEQAPHPWLGLDVEHPRGRGRLRWTDGHRAGVRADEERTLWLCDLERVRLMPQEGSRSSTRRLAASRSNGRDGRPDEA
jgi:hypothetical protein